MRRWRKIHQRKHETFTKQRQSHADRKSRSPPNRRHAAAQHTINSTPERSVTPADRLAQNRLGLRIQFYTEDILCETATQFFRWRLVNKLFLTSFVFFTLQVRYARYHLVDDECAAKPANGTVQRVFVGHS